MFVSCFEIVSRLLSGIVQHCSVRWSLSSGCGLPGCHVLFEDYLTVDKYIEGNAAGAASPRGVHSKVPGHGRSSKSTR